jgi:hypothetical protein
MSRAFLLFCCLATLRSSTLIGARAKSRCPPPAAEPKGGARQCPPLATVAAGPPRRAAPPGMPPTRRRAPMCTCEPRGARAERSDRSDWDHGPPLTVVVHAQSAQQIQHRRRTGRPLSALSSSRLTVGGKRGRRDVCDAQAPGRRPRASQPEKHTSRFNHRARQRHAPGRSGALYVAQAILPFLSPSLASRSSPLSSLPGGGTVCICATPRCVAEQARRAPELDRDAATDEPWLQKHGA